MLPSSFREDANSFPAVGFDFGLGIAAAFLGLFPSALDAVLDLHHPTDSRNAHSPNSNTENAVPRLRDFAIGRCDVDVS
jgi:hypothetical protein